MFIHKPAIAAGDTPANKNIALVCLQDYTMIKQVLLC